MQKDNDIILNEILEENENVNIDNITEEEKNKIINDIIENEDNDNDKNDQQTTEQDEVIIDNTNNLTQNTNNNIPKEETTQNNEEVIDGNNQEEITTTNTNNIPQNSNKDIQQQTNQNEEVVNTNTEVINENKQEEIITDNTNNIDQNPKDNDQNKEDTKIEDAPTNAQTPNTSFVQDEAPLPEQPTIIHDKKDNKIVISVEQIQGLQPTNIELQDLSPKKTDNKTKENSKKDTKKDTKEAPKPETKEASKPLSPVDKALNEVSKSSGLNLKAYFIEDNKKEIEQLKKSGNVKMFEFNGDMKEFYKEAYRYVLESNMIARQLNPDNKNLPDIAKLTEKFEEFMKTVGQELKDRNQIQEYVPFGGLSAYEIKQIQKDILLNRPQTREEALKKNATKLGGKNYDEMVENSYKIAHNTIETNFGKDYQVGKNPKLDEQKLKETVEMIKSAEAIDKNKKLWDPYLPKFSLPKFNKPIWIHPISNAFKLIGKGISIALDCAIKFPIANAFKAIMYAYEKPLSAILRANNVSKLETELVEKGFRRAHIREIMRQNNSKTLDVEKDSKNIDKQFEKNLKTIKEYKETKEKNKTVDKTTVKEVQIEKKDTLEVNNPNKIPMVIQEAATVMYEGKLTPKIEEKELVKNNELKIN